MFCSNCGAQNVETAKFCEKCGTPQVAMSAPGAPADTRVRGGAAAPSPAARATGKNPWLALVLSLVIVGVGQFYNGDYKKGALMLIGGIAGFAVSGGIITLVLWIWSMYDAWQVASGKGRIW